MDKALIDTLEQQMIQRREQLRDDVLGHLGASDDDLLVELHGQVRDAGEESLSDMLADVSIASIELESREIGAIEAALLRIRNGSYGECVECGQEIGEQRLQANPSAARCYDCQDKAEDNRSEVDGTPSL